jgi:hypothetical protein
VWQSLLQIFIKMKKKLEEIEAEQEMKIHLLEILDKLKKEIKENGYNKRIDKFETAKKYAIEKGYKDIAETCGEIYDGIKIRYERSKSK